jgi:pimeloyl-ACP methyl ester carboxylesterase
MAHEITGRYAIVDGARAYYDVCGSGIPLVCVHMGWACSLQWHYFMPIMAAAGFKVSAPDLQGHAKSMPVNWKPFRKMRDCAEWIWHFIETVCPDEKPVVCGSGIGGDMTLQIARRHPQGIRAGMPSNRRHARARSRSCRVIRTRTPSQVSARSRITPPLQRCTILAIRAR